MRTVCRDWWKQHQEFFDEIDKLADKAHCQLREGAVIVVITGQPYYCGCRDEVIEGLIGSQGKTSCWYIVPHRLSSEIKEVIPKGSLRG